MTSFYINHFNEFFIIISLVSEKNKYEINALMKKASFDNITKDILYLIKQQQNAMLSFF